MRLARVHIQGFRCLDDLLIDFHDVTAFVGANSTGKSSVLHALDWFFAGGSLHAEDVAGLKSDGSVSIAVTFTDLSHADLETFGGYVADGEMTLWRTWSPAEGEKLTGRALALPAFEKVRANEKKSDLNTAYRELRDAQPELELPAARSADAATDAMRRGSRNTLIASNPPLSRPPTFSDSPVTGSSLAASTTCSSLLRATLSPRLATPEARSSASSSIEQAGSPRQCEAASRNSRQISRTR